MFGERAAYQRSDTQGGPRAAPAHVRAGLTLQATVRAAEDLGPDLGHSKPLVRLVVHALVHSQRAVSTGAAREDTDRGVELR